MVASEDIRGQPHDYIKVNVKESYAKLVVAFVYTAWWKIFEVQLFFMDQ